MEERNKSQWSDKRRNTRDLRHYNAEDLLSVEEKERVYQYCKRMLAWWYSENGSDTAMSELIEMPLSTFFSTEEIAEMSVNEIMCVFSVLHYVEYGGVVEEHYLIDTCIKGDFNKMIATSCLACFEIAERINLSLDNDTEFK